MPPHSALYSTAIIVGAGRGTRLGTIDKVLMPLAGRPVLSYSLDAAQTADAVDAIVIVTSAVLLADIQAMTAGGDWPKVVAVVPGGERRQDSVRAGLAAAPDDTTHVAVHDAARPLVTAELFERCLRSAQANKAAIIATPVVDTLKRVIDERITETVSRDGLWAAQTPQAFSRDLLNRAFEVAQSRDLAVTDEASLFEVLGLPVAVVPGSPANLKITRPEDLPVIEALLAARATTIFAKGLDE